MTVRTENAHRASDQEVHHQFVRCGRYIKPRLSGETACELGVKIPLVIALMITIIPVATVGFVRACVLRVVLPSHISRIWTRLHVV